MGAICMVTDDAGYSDRATTLVSLLLDGMRSSAPGRTTPRVEHRLRRRIPRQLALPLLPAGVEAALSGQCAWLRTA